MKVNWLYYIGVHSGFVACHLSFSSLDEVSTTTGTILSPSSGGFSRTDTGPQTQGLVGAHARVRLGNWQNSAAQSLSSNDPVKEATSGPPLTG
jgi:hypothetical protein